jgi:hypothetical protein
VDVKYFQEKNLDLYRKDNKNLDLYRKDNKNLDLYRKDNKNRRCTTTVKKAKPAYVVSTYFS